jgi:glycosyltransferase involved in cell wall biosynthesis
MSPLRVQHFERRPLAGVFSIERVFDTVRGALPPDIEVRVRRNRFASRGVLPRLLDALGARACAHSAQVNHVLGDVHYLTWFLPRRGTLLTVHDCASLARLGGLRRRLLWLGWYWWPLRRAERVVAISEFTRRELAAWLPHARVPIDVIPPPLPRGFCQRPLPPRGARLRLLQVGTAENKNLARVIAACRELPVELTIVGAIGAAEHAQLRALGLAFNNRIELDETALLAEFARCDALIFASTYEGFGLPIIEAQSVGRPVITSRFGATAETAGGAACLVDPFDTEDIRRGICRLIEDPGYAAELVRGGLENAARFRPERIAAAYAALYRELGAQPAASPARARRASARP